VRSMSTEGSNIDEHLNLKQLSMLEPHIPGLGGFVSRLLASTYDSFVQILYRDIDCIINRLQANPELHSSSGEDLLTVNIRDQLICYGYNASHDTKFGGHTDLLVQKNDFVWLGEAKIHSSYDWLWKGFLQLTTRYSTGDTNQTSGGLIIYIKGANAKRVMNEWQTCMSLQNLEDYVSYDCPEKTGLAFFSEHKHDRSGMSFQVRHIPVLLHFNPKDESGKRIK
jgi:hypothetical protein